MNSFIKNPFEIIEGYKMRQNFVMLFSYTDVSSRKYAYGIQYHGNIFALHMGVCFYICNNICIYLPAPQDKFEESLDILTDMRIST